MYPESRWLIYSVFEMSENLSRYFENTGSSSVFDSIASAGPTDQGNDVKMTMVGPETSTQESAPAIRDLWIHPDDDSALTMLTSPGILSNNDLVSPTTNAQHSQKGFT